MNKVFCHDEDLYMFTAEHHVLFCRVISRHAVLKIHIVSKTWLNVESVNNNIYLDVFRFSFIPCKNYKCQRKLFKH